MRQSVVNMLCNQFLMTFFTQKCQLLYNKFTNLFLTANTGLLTGESSFLPFLRKVFISGGSAVHEKNIKY